MRAGAAPGQLGTAGSILRAGLAVLLVAVAALGLPRLLPPLAIAARLADDLTLARLPPAVPQHERIVIVGITEATLATLACRSPIDRRFLAGLIDRLERAGVAAIGLDVLIDGPTLPDADAALRQRLGTARVPVVLIDAHDATPLAPEQRAHLASFLDGLDHGYANLVKERLDGTVRWHEPRLPTGEASFPARLASRLGAEVPEGPFEIAWHGRPDPATPPFPVYPADVVPFVPAEWLAGKVVLVGVTLSDADRHRTPLAAIDRSTAGVDIQAHVLAQLLDGRHHPRLPWPGEVALALTLAALGLALGAVRLPFLAGLLLALMGLLAYGGVAMASTRLGTLLPLVPGSLAWLLGFATMTGMAFRREQRERQTLMGLFARHVSAPVAEEIWRERAAFMAGGRPRPQTLTATVLFSDIEGFTGVAERLEPEALMGWLEAYLERMVGIVTDERGLVLRFIGDALLAVYGVPVARTTEAEIAADAAAAARAALTMADAMTTLNAELAARGLPPIGIRIGIHTGPLIAGSLGGAAHLEYSLVGDTANTAARLEAFAKSLRGPGSEPCTIVLGEATASLLDEGFDVRPVGVISLKGKAQDIRAYELMARAAGNKSCRLSQRAFG